MNECAFEKFGVMLDCSRNAVMTTNTFKKLVDILSVLGYNTIRLYTEDTYEVDGEPYFGYLRGRYTQEELKEMDGYAKSKGIEIIPCIQTLAHLERIFTYEDYKPINDIENILFVGEERTYTLIENMFKTISECFSTKNVHIGMDEARRLGRGKYLDKNGPSDHAEIMKKHLDRVLEIAEKYGFQCEIWGDMYMQAAYGGRHVCTKDESARVKTFVPQNLTLCYWDYAHSEITHYENSIDRHRKLTDNVSMASGIWTWKGFCPDVSYSLTVGEPAIKACVNKGVKEFYFTMWGNNGGECSPFAALPAIVAGAEFAKGNFDMPSIKALFKQIIGIEFDLFSALEKPDYVYADDTAPLAPVRTSRAMFFCDPLCGVFDGNVKEGVAPAYYQNLSALLKTEEDNEDWGYLFKSIRAFSDVLAIKFDLGVKTRRAYKQDDKQKLEQIAKQDYPALLDALERFYDAFEKAWATERKPFGFEVQDIRIGGLIQRVKHCKSVLEKYLNDDLEKIEELEQEILPPFGSTHGKINGYRYVTLVTTSIL
ncbi:MAG: beta-N-acetylhexosaminidase [Clostridia bacterium]|nr:beta-N-acetylhexosaminidase [Clostridia bacterium]